MNDDQPSIQPKFRASYSWKSVPYTQDISAQSVYFRLPCNNILVNFRLLAQRFQHSHVTVLHVQVEKTCLERPYGKADITITLSDGTSKTEKIDDWHQDSGVFCFSTKTGRNNWCPDIKCDIDWYRFLNPEEWKNILNNKTVSPLKDLLFSSRGSDVRIAVGDQSLPAHRFVIEHHSPVLCAMLKETRSSEDNVVLRMHTVDLETMKEVLHFLYTDGFLVDDLSTWTSVIEVAMTFKFYKLHKYCYSKIIRYTNFENSPDTIFYNALNLVQSDNRYII